MARGRGTGLRFVDDPDSQRVVFARHASRNQLADELDGLGASRVLVLASERTVDEQQEIIEQLGERVVGTFTGVRQHVPTSMVAAASDCVSAASADVLLAVGGGSAIGAAKAVALEARLPIVAVPTTYAGSEVTSIWGMTADGRKRTGRDPGVRPRTVVYDPELTTSMGAQLTATSGLNAMAHCIDALWTPLVNPRVEAEATWAIEHLGSALPLVVESPENPERRPDLLAAAWLAGRVLHHTGSALHHKTCHVLGGRFDLPHAATHAVLLPYVVAFNAEHAPAITETLSQALGGGSPAQQLHALNRRLGITTSLADLGMREADVGTAVADVVAAAPEENPRPVTEAAARGLLLAAWAGDPPET